VIVLLALALAAYQGRRAFIRSFFVDGQVTLAGASRAVATASDPELDPGRVDRLRVGLIDGLGEAAAETLPNLNRLCARGQDVRVDVGFPTVSLPVQHVLWTGRSQQESGVLYRIPALVEPPPDALPAHVRSLAVAESHPAIVHSFGFGSAEPELVVDDPSALPVGWRDGFGRRAAIAVGGAEELVFVHILRVDEVGHAQGGGSPEYKEATLEADGILGDLLVASEGEATTEESGLTTRWVVLADHGHRDGGGHGGAEPEIRRVRACLVGEGLEPVSGRPLVGLSDLARLLGESLGVAPSAGTLGEPWSVALGRPAAPLLPSPSLGRWLAALFGGGGIVLLVGLALFVGRHRAGLGLGALGLGLVWPAFAYMGVVLSVGKVSLSNPAIYPPVGASVVRGAWPGWLALGLLFVLLRRRSRVEAAAVLGAGVVAPALGALILAGALDVKPPLMPLWTAQASVLLTLVWPASLAAAVWMCLPTSSSPPPKGSLNLSQ